MTNRIAGFTITAIWLVLMAMLMTRDVIPFWYAQEPPSDRVPRGNHQTAIVTENGKRIGTSWIRTIRNTEAQSVFGTTVIDLSQATSLLPVSGMLRLSSNLTYDRMQNLDEFLFILEAAGITARVNGERYDNEFACLAEFAGVKRQIALDARLSSYISDSMRPFTHLSGLEVGHTWRLRLLDPVALLTEREVRFNVQLVRVTAREEIEHAGKKIECFRIETDRTIAWADDDGRIIRQEVSIPLLGKWIMLDEPYDENARRIGIVETGGAVKPVSDSVPVDMLDQAGRWLRGTNTRRIQPSEGNSTTDERP